MYIYMVSDGVGFMFVNIKKLISEYMRTVDNRFVVKAYNKLYSASLPYQYVTMYKIAIDTVEWCKHMSSDFDYVVAMPRSGMIVGSMISGIFGKPLSTPDQIMENKYWLSSVARENGHKVDVYGSILLVDDTVSSGKQMNKTYGELSKSLPNMKIIRAALYVSDPIKVDRYFKRIDTKNTMWNFEYSIMHQKFGKIAFDMDGVLCEDYNVGRDYDDFIRNAKPYRIPIYTIDCIITARKEKYRELTEKWLTAHNVKWDKLVMIGDCECDVIKFKSDVLIHEKPVVYVESNADISEGSHLRTGTPVICIENNMLYR